MLTGIPTFDEVVKVVKSLKKWKSPGSDGLTIEFFQASWDSIKYDLVATIASIIIPFSFLFLK